MKNIKFKNLDITINSGELVGIIGPNGCGKTILMKMISGRIKNSYFYIDNKNVNFYSLDFKRNNIVCVFNDNIYNANNVLDELKYFLKILKCNDIDERIKDFINYFKLDNIINYNFENLRIEDRIYVKLLSLLIIKPSIYCVDDLFTYLSLEKTMRILNYIKERNITLLSVESNMNNLTMYDKLLVLNKGKKEMFDKFSEVLKNEVLFNLLGLNLPFNYEINTMLKSYDLIKEDHYNDKDLVDLLWK